MAQGKKLQRTFEKLESSLYKLKESLSKEFSERNYEKEIMTEIVTKRFEYTFEALWKCLREFLLNQGIETNSPLACFKEAYTMGLIDSKYEEIFPMMIRKRNEIVHIYSDEDAQEIYQLIQSHFAETISGVYENLVKEIKSFNL